MPAGQPTIDAKALKAALKHLPKQKWLCLCQRGNTRSAACAFVLKNQGHEALSAGTEESSPQTLDMLYRWADRIVITDSRLPAPERFKSKTVVWDVGPDRWFMPPADELLRLFKGFYSHDLVGRAA